jgi:hypothetical protein
MKCIVYLNLSSLASPEVDSGEGKAEFKEGELPTFRKSIGKNIGRNTGKSIGTSI